MQYIKSVTELEFHVILSIINFIVVVVVVVVVVSSQPLLLL